MTVRKKASELKETIDPVVLKPLPRQTAIIRVRGVTPLVTNNFSAKSRRQMLEAQWAKAGVEIKEKREPQDPEADFEAARYRIDDKRDGIPATAFKAATVDAARFYKGVTQIELKMMLYIFGEGPDSLVPIIAGPPEIWENVVRTRGKDRSAMLRWRPRYWPWEAELRINFLPTVLALESLVNLVNTGGLGGVGEWRPTAPMSKSGVLGTYEVISSDAS